jgi:hypothetical protein
MAGGAAEHMGTFIRQDQITEKLEIARTMGLVADFSVIPTGSPRRPDATVRVSPSARTSSEALRTYLARLLQGLVADHAIIVVQPLTREKAPGIKSHDAAFASAEVSAAA